jgi:hypothetical protein
MQHLAAWPISKILIFILMVTRFSVSMFSGSLANLRGIMAVVKTNSGQIWTHYHHHDRYYYCQWHFCLVVDIVCRADTFSRKESRLRKVIWCVYCHNFSRRGTLIATASLHIDHSWFTIIMLFWKLHFKSDYCKPNINFPLTCML